MRFGARIAGRLKRLAGFDGGTTTGIGLGNAPTLPPSFLRYKDYISVHPSAIIAPNAAIQMFNPPPEPRVCLDIGEGCHIFSSFNFLRPHATIRIGRNSQLGASQLIAADRIEVGDDVLMAWGCTLIDTDTHSLSWSDRRFDVEKCRKAWIDTSGQDISRYHDWSRIAVAPVSIGSKCWIGFNVTLLKGVSVGEGSIVGAASVVTRSIEPWTKAAGNPCRRVGKVG